jgi:hypothetical protein
VSSAGGRPRDGSQGGSRGGLPRGSERDSESESEGDGRGDLYRGLEGHPDSDSARNPWSFSEDDSWHHPCCSSPSGSERDSQGDSEYDLRGDSQSDLRDYAASPRGRGLLLNSQLESLPAVIAPAAQDPFVGCRRYAGMEASEPSSEHMVRRQA